VRDWLTDNGLPQLRILNNTTILSVMPQIIRQLIAYLGGGLLLSLGSCRETCFEEPPSLTVSITSTTVNSVRWAILDKTGPDSTIKTWWSLVRDKQTFAQLPLNFNAAETRYTLQADGGRVDTLTVRYALQPVFISQKCGYAISVRRPLRGFTARFTRDTLKAAYYNNEVPPTGSFSGSFGGSGMSIQLGL
jgi:Family of unknown function (DUF6452)